MTIQTRAQGTGLLDALSMDVHPYHLPEALQSLSVALETAPEGEVVRFIGLSSQPHPLKPVGAWIALPLPSVLPLEAARGATVKGFDGWGHFWALGQSAFSILPKVLHSHGSCVQRMRNSKTGEIRFYFIDEA